MFPLTGSQLYKVIAMGKYMRSNWGGNQSSLPPGLRGGLCLSFLCSKTIIVVFRSGTGIFTGLDWG